MNMHSNPQPENSLSIRLRMEAAARKARLYGAPRIINLISNPPPKGETVPAKKTGPKIRVQHDEHMVIWRWAGGQRDRLWLSGKCANEGLSLFDIIGKSLSRSLTEHRMRLYMLAKHELGMSTSAIGRLFGWRDHTTVLSGIRKAELQHFGKIFSADQKRRKAGLTEDEIERIGEAYLGGMTVLKVYEKFDISSKLLYRLAKQNGWRRVSAKTVEPSA